MLAWQQGHALAVQSGLQSWMLLQLPDMVWHPECWVSMQRRQSGFRHRSCSRRSCNHSSSHRRGLPLAFRFLVVPAQTREAKVAAVAVRQASEATVWEPWALQAVPEQRSPQQYHLVLSVWARQWLQRRLQLWSAPLLLQLLMA